MVVQYGDLGRRQFVACVPKRQLSTTEDDFFGSVGYAAGENLYFVYNDHKLNLNKALWSYGQSTEHQRCSDPGHHRPQRNCDRTHLDFPTGKARLCRPGSCGQWLWGPTLWSMPEIVPTDMWARFPSDKPFDSNLQHEISLVSIGTCVPHHSGLWPRLQPRHRFSWRFLLRHHLQTICDGMAIEGILHSRYAGWQITGWPSGTALHGMCPGSTGIMEPGDMLASSHTAKTALISTLKPPAQKWVLGSMAFWGSNTTSRPFPSTCHSIGSLH